MQGNRCFCRSKPRRAKGHVRLRNLPEDALSGRDARVQNVPDDAQSLTSCAMHFSEAADEVGCDDDEYCDVYFTSVPGVRPTCVQVQLAELRRQPTAALLKGLLVRIGVEALGLTGHEVSDAPRVEYSTAAGEQLLLTPASHAPRVCACAVEYRVVLLPGTQPMATACACCSQPPTVMEF